MGVAVADTESRVGAIGAAVAAVEAIESVVVAVEVIGSVVAAVEAVGAAVGIIEACVEASETGVLDFRIEASAFVISVRKG